MTTSANRSEADGTTTRPETPFYKKNQAELVLAQSRVFQQAPSFDESPKKGLRLEEYGKRTVRYRGGARAPSVATDGYLADLASRLPHLNSNSLAGCTRL
jgi:hypothetical protein